MALRGTRQDPLCAARARSGDPLCSLPPEVQALVWNLCPRDSQQRGSAVDAMHALRLQSPLSWRNWRFFQEIGPGGLPRFMAELEPFDDFYWHVRCLVEGTQERHVREHFAHERRMLGDVSDSD